MEPFSFKIDKGEEITIDRTETHITVLINEYSQFEAVELELSEPEAKQLCKQISQRFRTPIQKLPGKVSSVASYLCQMKKHELCNGYVFDLDGKRIGCACECHNAKEHNDAIAALQN